MDARVYGRRTTVLMLMDDPALVRLARSILEPGRKVSGGAPLGPESLPAARTADVVVIELNAVDPDTLAAVRSAHPDAALIVLSPERRETDCIAALDMGADYLPRPFSPCDLAARVRVAELRRFAATGRPRVYRHGALTFDLFTGKLSINDRVVELAPSERALFALLAARAGVVVAFESLLDEAGLAGSRHGRSALRGVRAPPQAQDRTRAASSRNPACRDRRGLSPRASDERPRSQAPRQPTRRPKEGVKTMSASISGLVEIAVTLALVLAAARPIGAYMADVFENRRTLLTPILGPIERTVYWAAGVKAKDEQEWDDYAISMVLFGGACMLGLYAILRLQAWLPLNPQGFPGVPPDLAFNIAVSFVTNANWQAYGGETTLSHLSQMVGLTANNFLDSAAAIAIAVALVRALTRNESTTIGNFWVDITRATLYVLLPAGARRRARCSRRSACRRLLIGSIEATTLEGAKQMIAIGPVASQEAIKLLGDNGGGFFNANSAHPVREPERLVEHLAELEPARAAGRAGVRLRPHGRRAEAGARSSDRDGGHLRRGARR